MRQIFKEKNEEERAENDIYDDFKLTNPPWSPCRQVAKFHSLMQGGGGTKCLG